MTWLGGVNRQICQRSTGTSSARWLPRSAARQNGGAAMFVMKRLVIAESPSTRVEGNSAITSRFMTNIAAPPFWRAALRGNHLADDVPVDRWQICRFTPPSHVMIEVGVAHAGHGGYDAPADRKVSSVVVDFITPETDTSIWYFWGMARNFNVDDQALTETIRAGQSEIFGEDVGILEAQQRNLAEQPSRHLMRLNIDMGGFEARRILERLVAEEQNDLLRA